MPVRADKLLNAVVIHQKAAHGHPALVFAVINYIRYPWCCGGFLRNRNSSVVNFLIGQLLDFKLTEAIGNSIDGTMARDFILLFIGALRLSYERS